MPAEKVGKEAPAAQSDLDDDAKADQMPLPPVDVIDWILFIPFLLAFGGSLLIFDILQRIALLFGVPAQQYVVRYLNWSLSASLALAGVKKVVEGVDPIPEGEPVIIISNHQSLHDIPILHTVFAKHWPRFISKQELAHWIPSVSFNLRHGGNAVIDRKNPRQAIPEIQALAKRMVEQKFASVIFPEGTRARSGELKPFRPAGVSTLFQHAPEARILLVAIDNSYVLSARKFGPIPRGTKVIIRILSELDRNGQHGKVLVERAEGIIRQGLQQLRVEKEPG